MRSKICYGLLWNISCWRKKPNNCRIWTPLHNAVVCIYVLLTPRLQLTLVDTKQKIKTYHDCITYSFLFEGCFCFPIFLCFPKHIKFDQNFVTKKHKHKNRNLVSSNIWQSMLAQSMAPVFHVWPKSVFKYIEHNFWRKKLHRPNQSINFPRSKVVAISKGRILK